MTPEANSKLQILRAKFQSGQTLTQEELREAVHLMREARGVAATASAAKATKKAKGPVDSDALIGELDGLS
jgi:hypothetical protein